MSRLYFLTPDLDTTVRINDELGALGLSGERVHVAGRDWQALAAQGIQTASLRQTSDAVHAAVRGVLYGAPLGMVLGLLVYFGLADDIPALGLTSLMVGMAIGGGVFGIWVSTMVGVSVHDAKIDKYAREIEGGAFLMMVDVSDEREGKVRAIIHRHHPGVTIDKVTTRERQQHLGAGD
ncbi:DUF1269 domain-containing protein [Halomonas nitroreducens]|uniref:DUF1269 domain-containing protein n=1 Tax=Halomonas nitroreducens TaxID=447425 RepID=A0A431V6K2_9GAMM|nr:DUF1269 domain-containing protein [Halomonas nitroreducens]RTR06334.1 DUF1269 domain-containing protein [Halomonas nitroreducens]